MRLEERRRASVEHALAVKFANLIAGVVVMWLDTYESLTAPRRAAAEPRAVAHEKSAGARTMIDARTDAVR